MSFYSPTENEKTDNPDVATIVKETAQARGGMIWLTPTQDENHDEKVVDVHRHAQSC